MFQDIQNHKFTKRSYLHLEFFLHESVSKLNLQQERKYQLKYTGQELCIQTEDNHNHLDMLHIPHLMDSILKDMYICYNHLVYIIILEYS